MGTVGLALDGKQRPVGQQRKRECVQLRQLAADHQRGAHHAPEGHHGALLGLGELRAVIGIGALTQRAHGQHIRVGPVTGAGMDAPLLRPLEHALQQLPVIPEVVGDAPHVGVTLQMLGLLQRRGARGQGQHDVPPALAAGLGDQLNLPLAVGIFPGDVVALDEVHAPGRVQPEDAVIVRPGAGGIAAQTVHVGVPGADGVGVGDLVTGAVAALDGQMAMGRHAGHAAHDMDAELEPEAVHIVRQGLEAGAVRCAGEAVHRRHQPPVGVHLQRREGDIGMAGGGGLIPLDVHHDVLPAKGGQTAGHLVGVAADDVLGDGGAVAVPAVPAHGGILGDHG